MSKRVSVPPSTLIKPLLKQGRRVSVRALKPGEEGRRLITTPRMGGEPYAEQGDVWPVCGGCSEEMAFVAQFQAFDQLWVFHYCFVCGPWRSSGGQDKEWCLRKYPPPSPADAVPMVCRGEPDGAPLPCAWEEESTWFAPGLEEAIDLVPGLEALLPNEAAAGYRKVLGELNAWQGAGTRVEGYAHWEQDPSSLVCGQDGRRMVLLAQVASNTVADVVFGDVGSVYLMVCPGHLDDVALEMQGG